MHRERVVERALAALELDGHGAECLLLILIQNSHDLVHVAGEAGDGEQVPLVGAGDVVEAAVVAGAVVEGDPAGEVLHGLRAGPVGVVLVPRDDAAVVRGFAEELIVPEADGAVEELRGGDEECGTPEDIVKCGAGAPGAERVKEDGVGVAGLVGVVLVEELVRGMGWLHEAGELRAQSFDLIVIEDLHAGEETVAVEGLHLFVGETVLLPFVFACGLGAEGAGGGMEFGEVVNRSWWSWRVLRGNGLGVEALAGFLHQRGWG